MPQKNRRNIYLNLKNDTGVTRWKNNNKQKYTDREDMKC